MEVAVYAMTIIGPFVYPTSHLYQNGLTYQRTFANAVVTCETNLFQPVSTSDLNHYISCVET